MKTAVIAICLSMPVLASAACELSLTDAEIAERVYQARLNRIDLFEPWPVQEVKITRDYQACHYAYVEWALPAKPGRNHIAFLHPDGLIKGAMAGH